MTAAWALMTQKGRIGQSIQAIVEGNTNFKITQLAFKPYHSWLSDRSLGEDDDIGCVRVYVDQYAT